MVQRDFVLYCIEDGFDVAFDAGAHEVERLRIAAELGDLGGQRAVDGPRDADPPGCRAEQ